MKKCKEDKKLQGETGKTKKSLERLFIFNHMDFFVQALLKTQVSQRLLVLSSPLPSS